MSDKQIKPTMVSLIVCDDVIEDITTRKKSLIGLFNNIHAKRFPVVLHQLVVYVAMMGHGTVPIRLELVTADDITEENGPILRIEQPELEFENPNGIVELVFKMQGVPFEKPGVYCFRVLSGNFFLGERKLRVIPLEGDKK